MPESKTRKAADQKRKVTQARKVADQREEKATKETVAASTTRKSRSTAEVRGVANKRTKAVTVRRAPLSRRWVAPTGVVLFLAGVAWLITSYLASEYITFLGNLNYWNIAIGMGLMSLSFIVFTQWK